MSKRPCIGIDFGELELRFAYERDGVPVVFPLERGRDVPKVVFDPVRKTPPLGVGFVGILQSVGTGLSFVNVGAQDTPDAYVERHLRGIHDLFVSACGEEPAATTLAVPTSLTQMRRAALIECARRAGLGTVSLIDRSLAVALALRTDKEQSATYVAFDLDYGDCEYALTRVARGRCWSVGSAVLPSISGERLTASVMEDIILALREKQIFLGLKQFTGSEWIELRTIAETIRQELARRSVVDIRLNPQLTAAAGTVTMRIEFAGYAGYVRSLLRQGIDDIRQLLEQNSLQPENLDAVLLLGYAARSAPVRDVMLEAFPQRVLLTSDDVLALGALAFACDAAGAPLDITSLPPQTLSFPPRHLRPAAAVSDAGEDTAARRTPQFSSIVYVEPPKITAAAKEQRKDSGAIDRIKIARSLIDQGKREEAETLVETLAGEIDGLRELLKQQVPTRAQQLLNQAQALLIDQHYVDAVALSHEAYALAPTDPYVFNAMMKLHADAGVAMNRIEQYDSALKILICAHGHDQTNKEIHRALAERHFIHAMAMRRLNNFDMAREAARTALSFDPKHAAANELHNELTSA